MTLQNEARRAGDAAGLRNVNFLSAVNFRDFRPKPYAIQAARGVDFGAINRAALPLAHAICRRLLPGGIVKRNEYFALAPHRADRRLGSFSVNLWVPFPST